jgi:hypothetical protein
LKQKDYQLKLISQRKKGHNLTVAIGYERFTVEGYVEIKVRHLKDGSGNILN